jgi:hypothetical protein
MISQLEYDRQRTTQLSRGEWIRLGLVTAVVSIVAVLAVQALAIAQWPAIALFAPLDSYARSALFTLVPVVIATFLLAWLVERQDRAIQRFIIISIIVLLISFIPDYLLPVPNKTVLASSVAAFLHVVAALTTVLMLVTGYKRHMR